MTRFASIELTDQTATTEPPFKSEIFDKPHIIEEKIGWRMGCVVLATEYDPIVYGENQTRQVIVEGLIKNSYQDRAVRQPWVLRERSTLYTRPGSVSVVRSKLLAGISRSGKMYHRWETQDVSTWYLTSKNNVATYRKGRLDQPYRKGQKRQMKLKSLPWKGILSVWSNYEHDIISAAMRMVFGKTLTLGDLYPVLSLFSEIDNSEVLDTLAYANPAIEPALATLKKNKIYRYSDDFKGMVKALNGGEINKAFLKEAANKGLAMTEAVGKLTLPLDYKVEYIRCLDKAHHYNISDPWPVMRKLDKNQRRSFFKKFLASPPSSWMMREIAEYMSFLEREDVDYARALKEPTVLHIHIALEALERQIRAARAEGDAVEITCWDRPELNIDLGDGIRIYLAENTMDMVRWGTLFNHCIGSSIHTERCTEDNLYGILEYHGKPLGNFNITNEVLTQAYGQSNTPIKDINKDVYEVFAEYLASVGIAVPGRRRTARIEEDGVYGNMDGNIFIAPADAPIRLIDEQPWQEVGWANVQWRIEGEVVNLVNPRGIGAVNAV